MNQNSQRNLKTPWPGSVLLLGIFHEHAILLVLLISFAPIIALIAAGPDALPGVMELALVGLSILLISGLARHGVVVPITRFLKRKFAGSAHVAYFRSFENSESHKARDVISPILGCIGRLTTVHNADYIQGLSGVDGHDQSDDTLFAWLETGEVLSDGLDTIKSDDHTWKSAVTELLQRVDLAVIDLSLTGKNIDWELEQTRRALPRDRIIKIAAQGSLDAGQSPDVIEYETSLKGRYELRRALRKRLASIGSEAATG